jgi:hypothetical protein
MFQLPDLGERVRREAFAFFHQIHDLVDFLNTQNQWIFIVQVGALFACLIVLGCSFALMFGYRKV